MWWSKVLFDISDIVMFPCILYCVISCGVVFYVYVKCIHVDDNYIKTEKLSWVNIMCQKQFEFYMIRYYTQSWIYDWLKNLVTSITFFSMWWFKVLLDIFDIVIFPCILYCVISCGVVFYVYVKCIHVDDNYIKTEKLSGVNIMCILKFNALMYICILTCRMSSILTYDKTR